MGGLFEKSGQRWDSQMTFCGNGAETVTFAPIQGKEGDGEGRRGREREVYSLEN